MKKSTFIIALTLAAFAPLHAQMGIGTTSPQSTLEISGAPANTAVADGVIAPKLTGSQLRAKNNAYTATQTGVIVYATAADTAPAGKTAAVTAPGYYYYDGNVWQQLNDGNIYKNDGTLAADRTIVTNGKNLTFTGTGKVGIGTGVPTSTLEVNGASTNTVSYNAGTNRNIDFSLSNLAYTGASAGGTFVLQNMKDGGTYTLSVRGTVSGTAEFTAAGFTVKQLNKQATTVGKETLYTVLVMGTTAYVYTASGF